MEEILRGYTIFFGRDPNNNKLIIAIEINGQFFRAPYSLHSSGNNGVSRCAPESESSHFSLQIDRQGQLILTNSKPQNCTLVNGVPIIKRIIQVNDTIEVGAGRINIDISEIIRLATQLLNQELNIAYDTSHLKDIWDDHYRKAIALQKKQKRLGLWVSGSMVFSLSATCASIFIDTHNQFTTTFIHALTVIAWVVCISSFYMRFRDNSIEVKEKEKDSFMDKYICPNSQCGRFFGEIPYRQIKNQYKICPSCKCKYKFNN